jgi:hypothetical protein
MKYFDTKNYYGSWGAKQFQAMKDRSMDILELKRQNDNGMYIAKNDWRAVLLCREFGECTIEIWDKYYKVVI